MKNKEEKRERKESDNKEKSSVSKIQKKEKTDETLVELRQKQEKKKSLRISILALFRQLLNANQTITTIMGRGSEWKPRNDDADSGRKP